jgi:hypothetical protein
MIFGALALATGDGLGQAQSRGNDVVLIAPTCPSCRVVVERWGELGGAGKEADGASFMSLQMSKNSTILGAVRGQAEIWRMDRNGNILSRIGRRGEGPGEFRLPWQIWTDPSDTAYVLDMGLARVSVLTPAGKYLRAFRVPSTKGQFLPLGGNRLLITGLFYGVKGVDERSAALPLHFIRADTMVKSFGVPIRNYDARAAYSLADQHLVAYGNSILTLPLTYRYTVDQWDTAGRLVRRLIREPVWFKPFDHLGAVTDPPDPMVVGAWVDSSSRLWVVTKHASDRWREAWSNKPTIGEGGHPAYSLDHEELLYSSTIEVIDLKKGTLIASTDIPFEFSHVLGRGILGQMKWDGDNGGDEVLYHVALKPN